MRTRLDSPCQAILVCGSSQSQSPVAVTYTVSASSTLAWDRLQRTARDSDRRCQARPRAPRIHARRCHRCGPTAPAKISPITLWIAIDTGSSSTDVTHAAISSRSTAQRRTLRRPGPPAGRAAGGPGTGAGWAVSSMLTRPRSPVPARGTSACGAVLRIRLRADGQPGPLPRDESLMGRQEEAGPGPVRPGPPGQPARLARRRPAQP